MVKGRPRLRIPFLLCVLCLTAACQNLPGAEAGGQTDDVARVLITFASGEAREGDLIDSFSPGYHRGSYGGSISTRKLVAGVTRDYPVTEQSGWVIGSLKIYCALFTVKPDNDIDQLLRQLAADTRVESAQPLYRYVTRAEPGYNDPYFELQYGEASPFIVSLHQWSTGRGIDIAVIDTGVDARHPDLRQQIAETQVFIDVGDQGGVDDIHGTAMAGIIAARANNGSGIVGIAPEARIHALKACRQLQESSSLALCDSFTLAQALSFAIDRRFDLINMSLSGPRDPLISRLIAVALKRDLVVAAADPGVGDKRYPALLPGVIAVREEEKAEEYIQSADGGLVVVAPRREVLSTGPGGVYDFYTGSSAATAIVSGLTALLLQGAQHMSSERRVAWLNEAMRRDIGPARVSTLAGPAAGLASQAETPATSLPLEF